MNLKMNNKYILKLILNVALAALLIIITLMYVVYQVCFYLLSIHLTHLIGTLLIFPEHQLPQETIHHKVFHAISQYACGRTTVEAGMT